jgi:hypothetical protein
MHVPYRRVNVHATVRRRPVLSRTKKNLHRPILQQTPSCCPFKWTAMKICWPMSFPERGVSRRVEYGDVQGDSTRY